MIASSPSPTPSGLMATAGSSHPIAGLDPNWLDALAQLPHGATLPMPQDWYDPLRSTLLIKQGHPVDQAFLARLLRFVQPNTTSTVSNKSFVTSSALKKPATSNTSRMSLPQGLSTSSSPSFSAGLTANSIVLVVEPDKVTCRKVLAQLGEANISSGRIRTVPALSWLDRSLRQLTPEALILGWSMSDPSRCEELWQLLRRLRRQYPRLQVVVLAGIAPANRDELTDWQVRASHTQANFLTKPLQANVLSLIMK